MSHFLLLSRRVLRRIPVVALAFTVVAAAASFALAAPAPHEPVAPQTVRLSPSGGLLAVEQQAPVATEDGASVLRIVLPSGAEDFQITVPGHAAARWSDVPQTLDQNSALARLRAERRHAVATLSGRFAAVTAQLSLWQGTPGQATFQDMTQREKRMAEVIPNLSYEKADLERRLALLRQELQALPPSPELGRTVLVTLQKPVAAATLPVRYSYTLRDCGWRPVYVFDARPAKGEGDVTSVRLMAEVWQFSGMDWTNARLTLVSAGGGPREPAPLPRWVIDSQDMPMVQPLAKGAPRMMLAANAAAPEAADAAPVTADVSGLYAVWTLAQRGLPEGRSRLLVAADEWKAPLQWLARPSEGPSRVWLMARYALPEGRAWPDGQAEFLVDGQSVGEGLFHPRGGEATLYFGADPRVQVTATADMRERGEKGLITKSRTWTWGWTYTVRSTRDRPVTVRIERPMPMIVDQGVTVTYRDAPQARQDAREHLLFWNVDVPAGGKAEVRHELTVTSPTEVQLNPHAP